MESHFFAVLVVNQRDLQQPLHPALSIPAWEQKGAALGLSQLGSAEASLQGWTFAAGRSLATGTGQLGCQTFPPPARGGWMLPQVVFGFFYLHWQILWGALWRHEPDGSTWCCKCPLGQGEAELVQLQQGHRDTHWHLLTLLDVWIYTNLREAESFKGYVPVVYREEKKYIFSQAADFQCIH